MTRAGLSRRGLLGAAGAAGSAAAVSVVLGAWPAAAMLRAPLSQQRAMTIRVARAGLVFPLKLTADGPVGSPAARRAIGRLPTAQRYAPSAWLALAAHRPVTTARLLAAERKLPAGQLTLARGGTGALIAAGLLHASDASLLEGVGRLAAVASARERDALHAAVTLAMATVFPSFSPTSNRAAQQWVSLLRTMHQRGTLQPALHRKGIR